MAPPSTDATLLHEVMEVLMRESAPSLLSGV